MLSSRGVESGQFAQNFKKINRKLSVVWTVKSSFAPFVCSLCFFCKKYYSCKFTESKWTRMARTLQTVTLTIFEFGLHQLHICLADLLQQIKQLKTSCIAVWCEKYRAKQFSISKVNLKSVSTKNSNKVCVLKLTIISMRKLNAWKRWSQHKNS